MPTELPLLRDAPATPGLYPGRWWHREGDRIVCDLCPRACALKPGDRGFCFVRQNVGGDMALTTYGQSTGFCIDPIEKKPLNHFYPGTSVLSFGTAGCNLGCKFCQNWDISKSREVERLSERALPEEIARAAVELGCRSVAFTYNDPVIWAEYAIDTARACRAAGVKAVAVTAGYITPEARGEFYELMDAANVDLKAFTEGFYQKVTLSHLQPVLDTLRWLKTETDVWFEITNLIIPEANDSPDELRQMCEWILHNLGDGVPVHFSAFHPDYKMTDRGRTPPETLALARDIALRTGLKFVYTGNVDDVSRQSTYCPDCRQVVIERNWYELGRYELAGDRCRHCGNQIPGRFDDEAGHWGRRRVPVDMRRFHTLPRPDNVTPAPPRKGTALTAPATAPARADLSDEQRGALLTAAADCVTAATHGVAAAGEALRDAGLEGYPVAGVYVSLKRGGRLRSCCGFLGRPTPLKHGLVDAAYRTATSDPRFPPVSPSELPFLDLEVWLLHPSEPVRGLGASRVGAVTVGRHGLHVARGDRSGLLLPGVPVEAGWDAEEFLNRVCLKAELPPTAWKEADTRLFRFEGHSYRGPAVPPGWAPPAARPLFTPEQLTGYAGHAWDNLVALLTGATPQYYRPGLPDANVNAVLLTVRWPNPGHELTAARLSPRVGMGLQATLFPLCEELARAVGRRDLGGGFTVELAVGSAPALHGTAAAPDTRGLDPATRAALVVEHGRTGMAFDPSLSPKELVRVAVEAARLADPEAAEVLSLETQSTRTPLRWGTTPRAVAGPADRPPAVAGTFYPADPLQLAAEADRLLGPPVERRPWSAVLVPHAGWRYSGQLAADVLKRVAFPRTVIALGPRHTPHGVEWAVAPHRVWLLPGARVESDVALARRLTQAIPGLELDAAAHRQEHGVEVELPLIHRLAPGTRVVGVAVGGGSLKRCEEFAAGVVSVIGAMDERPLLLVSSDMNHYAGDAETRRLDALALAELERLDPDALYRTVRANHISMCGVLPAVIVLKALQRLGALHRCERVGYATSADASGDTSRVVGYAGMLFE